VRVLQFGYGGQGKRHEQAWNQLGIEPHIHDPNQSRTVEGPWFGKWDLVDIVTPADSHFHLVSQALKIGVPTIFCEKPLSPFVGDVEEIQRVAGTTQVFVGYGYRFVDGMDRLRGHLAEKGQPLFAKFELSALKRARSDLNVLWADGSHLYDLARYLGIDMPGWGEVIGVSTDKTYCGTWIRANNQVVIEATSILAGPSGDPHVQGAKGCKRVTLLHRDYTLETLDFSSTNAVDLLVKQFQAILDGKTERLHTLEQSVELTRFLSEVT